MPDIDADRKFSVYLVMFRALDGLPFYKVGHTGKAMVSRRFEGAMSPRDVYGQEEPLRRIPVRGEENAQLLERRMLNAFEPYAYEPKHRFSGETECFRGDLAVLLALWDAEEKQFWRDIKMSIDVQARRKS